MMPAWLSAAALKKFGPFVAIALAVVLILGVAYCKGNAAGKQKAENARLERELQVTEDVGVANSAAADTRVLDSITLAEQKKELQDAISNGEDADTLRRRRGCVILRQQGRDTSRVPECIGFESRP